MLRRRRGCPEECGVGAQQRIVHLDRLVLLLAGQRGVGQQDGAAHRHLLQLGRRLVGPHGRGGLLVDPERRGRLAEALLDRVEHPVGADARDLPLARVVVLLPLGRGDDQDGRLLHVQLAGVDAAVALDGALGEGRRNDVIFW